MGEMKPQDETSGLVEREWVRRGKQGGELTERTLEGQEVDATWQDRQGHVRRASGKVIRNDGGELAIESWADGERRQTPVTRDANVDVMPRRPRSR
jgi:hypothetical protein